MTGSFEESLREELNLLSIELKENQIKYDEKLMNIIGRVAVQQSDLDLAHEKILNKYLIKRTGETSS